MKVSRAKYWPAVWLTVLAAGAAFRAAAEPPAATASRPERSYTGTVLSVDPKERVLDVKNGWQWRMTFNLGDHCTYTLLDNGSGVANDLRPGERVMVKYQVSQGVRIADRIVQRPLRLEGMVVAMEPGNHALILHQRGWDKHLRIADGCKIRLHDDQPGTFADLHAGDHVRITYEIPGGTPTIREIAQTSMVFTGKLTAIDLGDKTVKAKGLFESKKFNVANDCAIVINNQAGGKLSDLKPDQSLVFNYDPINGVNVVNRIGPAPVDVQTNSPMMTTTPVYPGYPMGY